MKHINQEATKVLMGLIGQIPAGKTHVRIDNAPGAYMAVSVEVLRTGVRRKLVSIAHRYEVNGDLVADPDVEFLVVNIGGGEMRAYPVAINHGQGAQEVAILDGALNPTGVRERSQRDVATFCGTWLRNIREQQGLSRAPRANRTIPPCAASMGCLCALHARAPHSPEACNASEGV